MELNSECNNILGIRHSKLGKAAFVIFVSIIVPYIIILTFRLGIIQLSLGQRLFLSKVSTYWIIFVPILSLILSIADLKRPNRLRILPKVTVVLSSIIIGIGILFLLISTISDLSRIF